ETDIFIGMSPDDGPQSLALKRANRHGLIAGATGTGKTVTLQRLAESFAREGVAVFAADVKGDLSGIAQPGAPPPKWASERASLIDLKDFTPWAPPVVFWDLYGEKGHPVRTTVTEMGPVLMARILDCSDAQEGAITVAFKLADDWYNAGADEAAKAKGLLLNLQDLRAILTYISDNADEVGKRYGLVSPTTVAALQRKLLQLEMDGAKSFFGEEALDLADMIRTVPDANGVERGVVNVLAADKLVQSPTLYSTFLLWLLSELWETLPEAGDLDKPKMVFFFDEAHLLFKDAEKALLDRVEQVARLIRSKGVGIYFVTQSPADIPDDVLAQLGNRIQHALRAYTPSDQKAVKAAAASFRANPKLSVVDAIQEMGVGEALVSTLDEKGAPTPVARTLIAPPTSRVGPCTDEERAAIIAACPLGAKYKDDRDRHSAFEVLTGQANAAAAAQQAAAATAAAEKAQAEAEKARAKAAADAEKARAAAEREARREAAAREKASRPAPRGRSRVSATERVAKQVGGRVLSNATNTLVREVMRGIFGNLKRY
ncbi:MAG TPA: helicase HerA-like domain-containing protein, partial [Caulobacterales bacterium]|nr:helicase HerA-like domain-containing protein [Caulobacterales bacterium]